MSANQVSITPDSQVPIPAKTSALKSVPRSPDKKANASRAGKSRPQILSAEEWMKLDLTSGDQDVIVGTASNPIIRPRTKNFIEAPEKAFKTTAVLRLSMGIAAGVTVFPSLPTTQPRKVLYLHGELSAAEIKERTTAALRDFSAPPTNFFQGRDLNAHLITKEGQEALRALVAEYRPDVLVLDPWQSFISGYDENSFKDMSTATRFLDTLIEEFGVTILIPIHQGKDHSRGARGHSSLAGWRDTRIKLEPIQNNLAVRVKVEPRWATPPDPFVLKFRDGTVWEEGTPAWTGQAGRIRTFVESKGGRVSKEEVGKELKLASDALRKAIDRAQQSNAIEIDGNDVVIQKST
jgi:hypothetical protein